MLSLGWKAVAKEKAVEKEGYDEEQLLSILPNLVEREILSLHSADISSHKTKPKPLYTEATLLSAMEHAGKEVDDAESKRAMADCGIGTPATRANIIETLILSEYIRREKKSIVPTEKGLVVYDIVKDRRIADAEMTGTWEVALTAIEAGSASAAQFNQRICEYMVHICEELLKLSHRRRATPAITAPSVAKKAWTSTPKSPNAALRGAT